jgi:hypothetical protein
MYIATTYGFGKRIADIKDSGGDVKKALKVSSDVMFCYSDNRSIHSAHVLRLADLNSLVFLDDLLILYPHKWLQQNGLHRIVLSRISNEALQTGLLSFSSHIPRLDCFIPFRQYFPV